MSVASEDLAAQTATSADFYTRINRNQRGEVTAVGWDHRITECSGLNEGTQQAAPQHEMPPSQAFGARGCSAPLGQPPCTATGRKRQATSSQGREVSAILSRTLCKAQCDRSHCSRTCPGSALSFSWQLKYPFLYSYACSKKTAPGDSI